MPGTHVEYPYLVLSEPVRIDSVTQPAFNLFLYMSLTGTDALPNLCAHRLRGVIQIPDHDKHWQETLASNTKLRSQTEKTRFGSGSDEKKASLEDVRAAFEVYSDAVESFVRLPS